MNLKYLLSAFAALVILADALAADAGMMKVEESTVSPIADMAMIDGEMKTSTEKPPIVMDMEKMSDKKENTQRHTVADFIIHPLIAFKPRTPEDDSADGRQAAAGSSTTASPWQLFGFNAGQGLGSSVSSLAGSVGGWLNDRIQLPGLVDTPVRDSTSTSTTTTTPRPDVVVRVQHKASTRRPIIAINNKNRPQQVNNNKLNNDSEEDDDDFEEDDDDFKRKGNRRGNKNDEEEEHEDDEDEDDDEDDNTNRDHNDDDDEDEEQNDEEQSEEDDDTENDEDEEEELVQRPNSRRRPAQQNQRRKVNTNTRNQQQRRRGNGSQRQQSSASSNRRRPQQSDYVDNEEDDDEEVYYDSRPSTKRSQNQANFIQRSQQSLLNQIRQLTRGQTPAEIGAAMRQSQTGTKRRRQQATLMVNRNGQTIYMAPELMNAATNSQFQYYPQYAQVATSPKKRNKPGQYPQPPLTVPLKRKGRPTQYITIPWSQLGISPPDQLVSLTEGIQSQPLILNIPQSAINTMQNPSRKKRPVINADAVPLLADASLMDVFKAPKIPPSRHTAAKKPSTSATHTSSPVMIATKAKPNSMKTNSGHLPQRIRPGTIVEMAPAMEAMDKPSSAQSDEVSNETPQMIDELRNNEQEFILVGEDNEPGLTRQVQPVYGDARYVHISQPYYESLKRGRFGLRKRGRDLEQPESVAIVNSNAGASEQLIPVQIISEAMETEEAVVAKEQEKVADAAPLEVPALDLKPVTVDEPAAVATEPLAVADA